MIRLEFIWLVLSDEQMSKSWPFSLLNDEQMSNWLGVEHLPVIRVNLFLNTKYKTWSYLGIFWSIQLLKPSFEHAFDSKIDHLDDDTPTTNSQIVF